ncbi:proliferation marker protein Ki-67 [Megalops cyprinoides]|uniref:proliferation marker protein Ki-67 n=1 Tax=Megalops cyprinoides TaxID=118141 RepID=UPI0018644815|nr:proliferation marker protein Ki-67 [Megalops cyprinoides]
MPLHGKIVVIKRSGGDGTEFPLTASCLFGRKPDCDIRIQLPQVSKEHCRIDLNENKEVILTNLSSVNPTRINGEIMQQTERLKHGDLITIIDRSFRFEYPPEPTPKKRRPSVGKSETLQVLHDQQARDQGTLACGERRKSSELTSDSSCLKDGTNAGNVQSCTVQDEDKAKEVHNSSLEQNKTSDKESLSPFCELYEMIKQNLNAKSPWKPSEPKTPLSRHETPKTIQAKKMAEEKDRDESLLPEVAESSRPQKTPERKRRSSAGSGKHVDSKLTEGGFSGEATPKSGQKSSKLGSVKTPAVESVPALPAEGQAAGASQPVLTPSKETPGKNRRPSKSPAKQSEIPVVEEKRTPGSQRKARQGTPQKFSAGEVAKQIVFDSSVTEEACQSTKKSKTPKGRRSKECGSETPVSATPSASPGVLKLNKAVTDVSNTQTDTTPKSKEVASPQRVSPRKSAGKKMEAPNVLVELGLTVPSSGGKGNQPSSRKKRKSMELESGLPTPQLKRKRVSFGGQLSPELFDKRLPPNSPLRRGATPGRRSLSLFKHRSVLRRASTIGLIQELHADMVSPQSQKAKGSPGKKASPRRVSSVNSTPSPTKKSTKSKAKTPSPQKPKATSSPGPKSPALVKTPSPARQRSSSREELMTPEGKKSVTPRAKTPSVPSMRQTPAKDQTSSTPRAKKSPLASSKTPSPAKDPVSVDNGPSTPATTRRGRTSISDASKTPSPARSAVEASETALPAEAASGSIEKTPSPRGRSFNDSSSNQTPTVRGRFSVSRIDTPSPVADQNVSAPEGTTSEVSASVTPTVPLKRTSMKSTSKKTPKSARKSVLEVIRSRRSGASRANLKVVSSWADIVKFGVTKPQVGVPTKKCTTKGRAIKKAVAQRPKTPARKVKEHVSTGHAASPATILVGKAHTKVAPTAGCAPKLVHNIALLRKNMEINEDLTGIKEIFSTPVNVREKRPRASTSYCPETSQTPAKSLAEVSVMDTPEGTGEMMVSPLSTVEQGRYNSDAVTRLLQEDGNSSFISDAPQANDALKTPETPQTEPTEPGAVSKRTPKQKPEALTCLTGVKRLMRTPKQKPQQVEDLRGIKRLLKTPREPKVPQEVSLVGVKEMLKTPKHKGQPVEDMAGVQRVMKTPKVKKTPLVCTTGLKRLMQTPKQKVQPVEDMVGVKRLMQTPKQKVQPVEDMAGVKRLMQTPKQKVEPVEDMVGVKRLMQTPKQKVEPVEDMVGVKRLMQTPKQKGQPVENKFGIRKLMKSPRARGVEAVEDFTGLPELLKEPEEVISKQSETTEEKVSENPESGKSLPALNEVEKAPEEDSTNSVHEENQSNSSKKSGRGRPPKQVKSVTDIPAKDGKLAGSQCEAENDNVGDDHSLADTKPKRGRRPRKDPVSPVKKIHQQITEIKEEDIKPVAAVPTKSTRGRRAKVMESEQNVIEEILCESVKLPDLTKECDEVKTMDVEIAEPTAPAHVAVKGRRGKTTVETPQKVPSPAPIRKTGRGRTVKGKDAVSDSDTIKAECVEMPPTPAKDVDTQQQICITPASIVKPRRGRKPKQTDELQVTSAESVGNVSTDKPVIGDMPEPEEQTPVVKSGRGRKAKAVVKEEDQTSVEIPRKRMCRGTVADGLTVQAVASPISRSVRGRKPAKNLDSAQVVTVVQDDTSATKCSTEPNRKTRGTRKLKSPDAAVSLSDPVPSEGGDSAPETSVSDDQVKNVQGKTSRRGRAAAQKTIADEASEKTEIKKENVDKKGEVKKAPAKKAVKWSSDLVSSCSSEVEALPTFEEKSQQGNLDNSDESTEHAGSSVVETEAASGQQTKSRRGRGAGKQQSAPLPEPSLVAEHGAPEPCVEKATRKGRTKVTRPAKSDPAKDDPPVAKRAVKRKAQEEVAETTGGDEQASESANINALPKRSRGRMAKVEETIVEANTSEKRKRGTARVTEKALENEVENADPKPKPETTKPLGRGRRKVAQQAEEETKLTQDTTSDKGRTEATKDTATVARGRGKTQKKADSTISTEPMPVRRTRRK